MCWVRLSSEMMKYKTGPQRPLAEASGQEVYDCALKLLSQRAYSGGLLALRLRQRGAEKDTADEAVARLTAAGLLNDEAYARRLFELWQSKGSSGRAALAAELKRKLIPSHIAEKILDSVSAESEQEAAAKALAVFWRREAKKIQTIEALPGGQERSVLLQKLAAAAGRYLVARGFKSEAMALVWDKLGEVSDFRPL